MPDGAALNLLGGQDKLDATGFIDESEQKVLESIQDALFFKRVYFLFGRERESRAERSRES